MKFHSIQRRLAIGAVAAALVMPLAVQAGAKEIKIGVIFDYTGPLAAGGSEAGAIGTKIAIDMINERGGVEGYRINAIFADAQSKPEVPSTRPSVCSAARRSTS